MLYSYITYGIIILIKNGNMLAYFFILVYIIYSTYFLDERFSNFYLGVSGLMKGEILWL